MRCAADLHDGILGGADLRSYVPSTVGQTTARASVAGALCIEATPAPFGRAASADFFSPTAVRLPSRRRCALYAAAAGSLHRTFGAAGGCSPTIRGPWVVYAWAVVRGCTYGRLGTGRRTW